MLPPYSLAQLRFYLLKSIFGDCFPLFMNREEKDTFLGSDSSYTITNVQSRPDAHALKVHFPPSSIRRSPGVAWGHWPPADLYLCERSLIQCVSQWNGELLTQGTKPCSSILIWEGQPSHCYTFTSLWAFIGCWDLWVMGLPPYYLISLAHVLNFIQNVRGILTNFLRNVASCHTLDSV